MKKVDVIIGCLIFCLLGVACNDDYVPRPKEFPYIPIPAHTYRLYKGSFCPFSFEINKNAVIERDTAIIKWKPESDCWMNIRYPRYSATIYLTYRPVEGSYTVQSLRDEAHRLTFEHVSKATYISPQFIHTKNQNFALVYNVGGDAASATQFFLTDTSAHWLRGALYFYTSPNADSLAPLIDYINEDILHMINTLQWLE